MYSVRVRRGVFKRTYRRGKGDLILCDDRIGGTNTPLPVRVLILDDNTRVEVPMNGGLVLEFSRGRFDDIKEKMEIETGQTIKVKGA